MDTGGPAFPGGTADKAKRGLTKRDWFAGMAMQVFVGNGQMTPNQVAELAYSLADAMLEARTPPTLR